LSDDFVGAHPLAFMPRDDVQDEYTMASDASFSAAGLGFLTMRSELAADTI